MPKLFHRPGRRQRDVQKPPIDPNRANSSSPVENSCRRQCQNYLPDKGVARLCIPAQVGRGEQQIAQHQAAADIGQTVRPCFKRINVHHQKVEHCVADTQDSNEPVTVAMKQPLIKRHALFINICLRSFLLGLRSGARGGGDRFVMLSHGFYTFCLRKKNARAAPCLPVRIFGAEIWLLQVIRNCDLVFFEPAHRPRVEGKHRIFQCVLSKCFLCSGVNSNHAVRVAHRQGCDLIGKGLGHIRTRNGKVPQGYSLQRFGLIFVDIDGNGEGGKGRCNLHHRCQCVLIHRQELYVVFNGKLGVGPCRQADRVNKCVDQTVLKLARGVGPACIADLCAVINENK